MPYQIAMIARPAGWTPGAPDDVPPKPGERLETIPAGDELFEAVRRAIEHNEKALAEQGGRWAVVIEPGSRGQTWADARRCTPMAYKVAAIWWPEGWEPGGPLDVPNCVFQTQDHDDDEPMSYQRAQNAVRALNRQCIDSPGATWHVVVAIENESISRKVSYEATGTETVEEVRRLHVIRVEEGGRGDCSHCPAHSFECAKAEWTSQAQTITATRTRGQGE